MADVGAGADPGAAPRLLEAQARYGTALLEQYADPARRDLPRLEELRASARVARTNAESSVERTRSEPARRRGGLTLDGAGELVQQVRAYALAALALQAHLPDAGAVRDPAPLVSLSSELDDALAELASALREDRPPHPRPSLRAAHTRLRAALDDEAADDPATALDAAVLDVETGQLVDSAVAVADVLGRRPAPPRPRRRQAAPRRRRAR